MQQNKQAVYWGTSAGDITWTSEGFTPTVNSPEFMTSKAGITAFIPDNIGGGAIQFQPMSATPSEGMHTRTMPLDQVQMIYDPPETGNGTTFTIKINHAGKMTLHMSWGGEPAQTLQLNIPAYAPGWMIQGIEFGGLTETILCNPFWTVAGAEPINDTTIKLKSIQAFPPRDTYLDVSQLQVRDSSGELCKVLNAKWVFFGTINIEMEQPLEFEGATIEMPQDQPTWFREGLNSPYINITL